MKYLFHNQKKKISFYWVVRYFINFWLTVCLKVRSGYIFSMTWFIRVLKQWLEAIKCLFWVFTRILFSQICVCEHRKYKYIKCKCVYYFTYIYICTKLNDMNKTSWYIILFLFWVSAKKTFKLHRPILF